MKLHLLASKLLTLLLPFCVACSGGDDDDGGDGTPTANEWNGKTYLVEFAERHWSEPRGQVVLDFAPYVPGFLLEVNGTSTSSYDVKAGTLALDVDDTDPPAMQDTCNPTSTISGAGNVISAAAFPMNIRHLAEDLNVSATVRNLKFTDVLPVGGVVGMDGKFEATLDARDVAPLFTQLVGAGETPTAQMLCDTLSNREKVDPPAPCQACPHDGAVMCLTLKAEAFGASETSLRITDVSQQASQATACQGGLSD